MIVSWPSKEDIASHMALTQLHRLQIDGELNTRKSEYTGMYSRAKLHGMSKVLTRSVFKISPPSWRELRDFHQISSPDYEFTAGAKAS